MSDESVASRYELTEYDKGIAVINCDTLNPEDVKLGDNIPYIIYSNNVKRYYLNGKLSREIGPAEIPKNGEYLNWYLNGEEHRIGGPSSKGKGCEYWRVNGKLNRLDGPAVKTPYYEEWYIDGKLDRKDGGPNKIEYYPRKEYSYKDGILVDIKEYQLKEEEKKNWVLGILNSGSNICENIINYIKQNPFIMKENKYQTLDEVLAAVRSDGMVLNYIADKYKTKRVYLEAVRNNWNSLQFVKLYDENILSKKLHPEEGLENIFNDYMDVCAEAIDENVDALIHVSRYINNKKLYKKIHIFKEKKCHKNGGYLNEILKNDPLVSLIYDENPTESKCIDAIKKYPSNIFLISHKKKTKNMYREALKANPIILLFFDIPTYFSVERSIPIEFKVAKSHLPPEKTTEPKRVEMDFSNCAYECDGCSGFELGTSTGNTRYYSNISLLNNDYLILDRYIGYTQYFKEYVLNNNYYINQNFYY